MVFGSLELRRPEGRTRSPSWVEECKVLPHLGNQLAFFVDKEKRPSIRFL